MTVCSVLVKSIKQLAQSKNTIYALVSDETQPSLFIHDKVWWKTGLQAASAVCCPLRLGFSVGPRRVRCPWRTRCLPRVDLSACKGASFSWVGWILPAAVISQVYSLCWSLRWPGRWQHKHPAKHRAEGFTPLWWCCVFSGLLLVHPSNSSQKCESACRREICAKGFSWLPPINCPIVMAKSPREDSYYYYYY